MSEVLTRSLATSFCTLIPVASLLIFGGETLQSFAIALLVGIASGAYSSIFIASPVLTSWKEREPGYARRAARQRAAGGGRIPAYYEGGKSEPLEDVPTKAAQKAPLGADGLEQLSKEEFKRMADQVAADLAEQGEFAHAPDFAEADLEPQEPRNRAERRQQKKGNKN
jgi:SecD/SecF fusion protein